MSFPALFATLCNAGLCLITKSCKEALFLFFNLRNGTTANRLDFANVDAGYGNLAFLSQRKLFKYSLEGIVAFSTFPLTLASLIGCFCFLASIISMIFIIARRLCFGDPVAGWASTVTIVVFIAGIQLLCMGILGLYLSKTYLETKRRPIYIVSDTNLEKDGK